MKKIKDKKIFLKKISLSICLALLIMLIDINSTSVNATNNQLPNQPSFEVKINSATPNPALIGEDITINGMITPQPFETEIKSQKKEIVLVLDVSRSMSEQDKTTNNSATKIAELKKAANDFIDKLKDVPNLKIGIVAFSSEATMNPSLTHYDYYKYDVRTSESVEQSDYHVIPDYQSSGSNLLYATNSTALKGMINGLEALGGTNTGEGLRKAEYMLEHGDSEANKSIVFMSDGEPTFYSINRYYDYYTSIDNINPSYEGNGKTDDDLYCKKYAEKIGAIIQENKRNVFSIGYGLGNEDSEGNATMKDIHDSMGGIDDNFFATDSGAIDGVLSGIADKIIKSYTIDNLTMNMNFNSNDGFSLNIGGNTVKLDNIVYNKVDTPDANGKYRYEAAPVSFSFVIKGNKVGEYNNVFKDSNATFSWEGASQTGSINQNNLIIKIHDNQIPNIQATLESATPNPAKSTEEIEVKYRIDTQPFEYDINNSSGKMIDEAVFVVDLSKNMAGGNRWQMIQNWFTNILLNDTNNGADNTLKNQNIKFGVVGYNDSVIHPIENGDYDRLFNRNDSTERETLRKLLQDYNDSHEVLKPQDSTNRNIGTALAKADDILQNKGQTGKNKAIVLINSGNVNYSEADINTIKNRGYKIISVDLSSDKNQNPTANLKNLHSDLLGSDSDYFNSKNDGDNFNSTQVEMQEIAERLKAGINQKTLSVVGAKLNFDLGENFDAVENNGLIGTGQVRTVNIPEIKYTLTQDETSGKYLWKQTEPQPLEVTFKIKPKEGKTGNIGFANDSEEDSIDNLKNYISYKKFDSTEVKKHIETPVITIASEVFPKINAEVVNPPKKLSQELSLQYKINAEKFKESIISNNSSDKDVVFALDISKSRKSNGKSWRGEAIKVKCVKDALAYNLMNNVEIKNAKYGIVTYSQKIYDSLPMGSTPTLMEPRDLAGKMDYLQTTNSGASQIPVGEGAAKEILSKYGCSSSNKYVVIISSGHGAAKHQIEYNVSSGDGTYNRITLNLSDIEPNEVDQEIKSIFEEIKNAKNQSYTFKTKLKFHTDGKFSAGDGLNTTSDSWYDVETPEFEVKYNLDQNGDYVPESVPDVQFKIIPKTTESLEFGDSKDESYSENKFPGAVSYINLSNEPVFNRIKPFKINEIFHGIYKGIGDYGVPNIDKPEGTFAKGSVVPMAASFDFNGNTEIQLTLDSKGLPGGEVKIKGDIIIYKVDTNGKLTQIGTMNGSGSNYSGHIENLSVGDKILILYNAELPTIDGNYTNYIKVGNSEKIPAELTVGGELPDLF